jgi:segregation and condensation protein B
MAKKSKKKEATPNKGIVGSLLAEAAAELEGTFEETPEAQQEEAPVVYEEPAHEETLAETSEEAVDETVEVAAEVAADEEIAHEEDASEISEELLTAQDDGEAFLPENAEDEVSEEISSGDEQETVELAGTELDNFESAEIEEVEFVEDERLESIIESILFASDRPVSLASIKAVFKDTNVKTDKIRRMIEKLQVEYAGATRGVTLEEVSGGYQLRTKLDNMEFLRRTLKARAFKLSGPALEVLSIVAYKQPLIKAEIDEIRGVESGHLLRALMERGLVNFEGKSELPGRPMQYGTTRKFLEIFGLRNLKELPTLSQIDEILPEGIGEEEKEKLSDVTAAMSEEIKTGSFSEGEEELMKITSQLEDISTSSNFFEEEKARQKKKKDEEKAQNIREALAVGEEVPKRDINWLKRYEEALAGGTVAQFEAEEKPADTTQEVAAAAEDSEPGLFEEEAPHMDEELPFYEEADEGAGDGEASV